MRPVELAFQLVELLSLHQPVGVGQLARLADIPKSTAQRTLHALKKTGWVEPSAGDRPLWRLTMRALVASGRANLEHRSLRSLALPVMEELRRATEETVHLTCRFQNILVLVERLDGIKPVRYFFPYGGTSNLHSTATGKAILASLPQIELDEFLGRPLRTLTPHTLTDPDALRRDLAQARERGYAVNLGGNIANVHGVGAAILDPDGRPFSALSVSAPGDRFPVELAERFGPLVADAARRVSLGVASQPALAV